MSFRKRGLIIGTPKEATTSLAQRALPDGARPSPLDGRLTTSTGTSSLDQLLAGHSGLPLGTSVLIEENGTTDFGGVLLRYYAAEGLVQGHGVHVLGVDDSWRRELPGLGSEGKDKPSKESSADSKMKIAWRYESLGNRTTPTREPQVSTSAAASQSTSTFCHTFNLTKRLESTVIKGQFYASPINPLSGSLLQSPLKTFLGKVLSILDSTPPTSLHRILVPSLLSPTLYGPSACQPSEVLQFLHALRALLRRYSTRLTAFVTVPISLFPRSTGLIRWAELLSDGVLELVPLQQETHTVKNLKNEDKAQGLLKVHSLPIFHEKGGGMDESWRREDLSFRLSASTGLIITPYSLPPIDEDETPTAETKKADESKKSLEF